MNEVENVLSNRNQHKNEKSSEGNKALQALSNVSQIGTAVAASILVGVLLGRFLDNLLGTTPWFLLIFSLLGMGAAIKSLFDISKKR